LERPDPPRLSHDGPGLATTPAARGERRREIVRRFFNDFWRSSDDKPATFAERLNRAEGHINERLAACGETWQLEAATRKQLGLPRAAKQPLRRRVA